VLDKYLLDIYLIGSPGVIVDGSSNEPLIGANVSIKGTTSGTFMLN
jgi:hypothetical protein